MQFESVSLLRLRDICSKRNERNAVVFIRIEANKLIEGELKGCATFNSTAEEASGLKQVQLYSLQDVNLPSVADCRIFDCQPVFNAALPQLSSIDLKMGDSRPLLNHALEHYASRHQATLSQFSLCMVLGLLPGGFRR